MVKKQSPEFARDLLSKYRKKMIIDVLIAHCRLNRHMYIVSLAEDGICRSCRKGE